MPRPAPPAERRRASSVLAGLAALTGMLALVVAVPVVLLTAWQALGPPIPSPRELTGPDDGTVFVRVLCLVAWLAWASFTWATLAEVLAQWRGLRLPAVGWQQRLAADLIAAVVVLFASPTVVSSVAAPLPVPAATAYPLPSSGPSAAGAHARQQSGRAAYVEHHVQAGEQLPALAERYLGDKYRWQAIAAATYGLPQPDGRTLRPGDTRVYPGWTVRIPTTSVPASSTVPAGLDRPLAAPAGGQQAPGAVEDQAVEYQAREGDWVWYIADRFLGDPDRYPEIAALNPDLARKYGTAFPDHVEPGDTLHLPADAHDRGPRPHATGTTRPSRTPPAHSEPGEPRGPAADTEPGHPAPPATTSPAATPSPSPDPPPAPATGETAGGEATAPIPTTAIRTPTPGPHVTTAAPTAAPAAEQANPQGGIEVGARGWVTTDLAAAVAAAAALVWIRRRRRYRPRRPSPTGRRDSDLAPLPVTVTALHGAHRTTTTEDDMDDPEPHARLAATVTHATLGTDTTGQTVHLSDLPALGVGWTGPGAGDAARGLIVSILSAGGPWTPSAEATLITTRQTLAGLLPDADPVPADPLRLQIADTTEQALNELERQLLRRARLAADLDTAAEDADGDPGVDEPQLPPMVFLATAPTGSAATRLAAILTVGSRLAITAVLLGDWPIGATWHLNPDGTTTGQDQAAQPGQRVNTLDETAAAVVLHTLRQAHPADDADDGADDGAAPAPPPPPSLPSLARTTPDQAARLPGHGLLPVHRPPGPMASSGPRVTTGTGPRLQLNVLGRPTVRAIAIAGTGTSAGTGGSDLRIRRSDGIQLLVYLAVEPSGATSDELMALLWPEIRPRHSRGRFHTTLSELRHTLVDALGADPIARTHDRYHLDPNLVEVDLWNLAAAADRAATAVEPAHHAALHDLIALYTGAVAEGHTWLWLDPYRESVRRHVLDAYATLAETEPDPHAALTLIQDAIQVDPYNEHLYQLAMHLHARLGSPDGVRRTLRTITRRLGELEIPLSPRTQQTASLLIERLDLRERLRPTT